MTQRKRSIRKKTKNQAAPRKIKSTLRQKLIAGGVIALALLFAASMYFTSAPRSNKVPNPASPSVPGSNATPAEPKFVKEGILHFVKNNQVQTTIDIEVARYAREIEQGLMHRQKMDENKGMLFIFPDEQPRGFWMKNTFIPLDIIYVDADKTIVSIQKNTTPLSEESLPSDGAAQYVVEVNAGFCDAHSLTPGDRIDFFLD